MPSDRWEEINRLYNAAVEVEEHERTSFLEKACGGDAELRREVESLLAYDKEAQPLLDRPALQVTAEKLASEPRSLVGRKLGPYQIQVLLGSGGMGEVYRARDTRLNRTVAIKVLPRHLSERADLRRRFEREARAIANLNHPQICALYDIGREDGIDFLVMEYLEGETLSQRLKKGPFQTEQLLRTAIEIATGLDQAHRQSVTHRDLKPGNIMLTKAGAKLLDFGLAKKTGGTRAPSREDSSVRGSARSTLESLTEEGMLLGTLEYMAPEQLEGKEADTRTDIFALGVVIYEMATGRKAFEGESRTSLAAAILTSEPPPITRIQPMAPPALERVVKKCLEKDPEERWQSARDLTSELKWIAEAGRPISATTAGAEADGVKPITKGRKRDQLAWALAVAFLIAAIVSALSYLRLVRAPATAIIAEIVPPEKTQFNLAPKLSPDGRTLAFSATDESGKTMLWVRSLDSFTAQPLAGTEGAAFPFWSADSRAIGFFSDRKLKTIEASGGPALVLADAPDGFGGSWNRDGTILFVPGLGMGLYQVAASGGTSVPVIELDPSEYSYHAAPRFLPDGKHFLYLAQGLDPASTGIYFASLDGKENRILLRGQNGFTYGSGFLLYRRDTTLTAQPLDPERGQLKGDPHPVADYPRRGFDVSQNGVLIYQAGESGAERRLVWFDPAGKEQGVIGEARIYYDLRLSPDGGKLAFAAGDPYSDLWVDDLRRGVRMRLTNDPGADKGFPVWSPDGSRILFGALRGKARLGIYQKPSNGSGGEELLLPSEASDPQIWPTSWSRDGKFILYSRGDPSGLTRAEIWVLPLAASDRKPRLFVKTPVAAYDGQFSSDDRWVAYTSKESGREEVYVVPFDATKILNTGLGSVTSPGSKLQISPGGGRCPRWRRDGKKIFYLSPGNQMMAAEVEARSNSFEARKAQPLFRAAMLTAAFSPYDVTPDGKRFVINTISTRNKPLTLVVNWTALLGNNP